MLVFSVLYHCEVQPSVIQDNVRAGYELQVSALGAEDPAAGAADALAAAPDLAPQKVASELHPKVRNHGEGPY